MRREDVCRILEKVERILIIHLGRVSGAEIALFHIRKAKESIGCPSKEHVYKKTEEKLRKEGIII